MYQVSQKVRRIVGRFSSGEELVEALTDVCSREQVTGGQVRLSGRVSGVEVVRFDESARQYEVIASVSGAVELVSATGIVSVLGSQVVLRVDGVMSAQGPLGPQLLAGQLRSATVVDVEFVVEVFEDLTLSRSLDRQSGQLVLDTISKVVVEEPEPAAAAPAPLPAPEPKPELVATQRVEAVAPAPAPTPAPEPEPEPEAPKMSWGEATAVSEKIVKKPGKLGTKSAAKPAPTADQIYADLDLEDDEDEDLPEMRPGDFIEHPKLGRCRVMRVEDEEYAHIRLPRGKISKLMLDLFDISHLGEEGGKNVFKLRMHT